jgi:hypothetical protein
MDQQVKYAALILFTILHELGHWAFFKFGCNLNKEKHTPCGKLRRGFYIVFVLISYILLGILMEESGEASEHLLFGFRIQHYGVAHPKFHVCMLNRSLLTIVVPLRIVNLG